MTVFKNARRCATLFCAAAIAAAAFFSADPSAANEQGAIAGGGPTTVHATLSSKGSGLTRSLVIAEMAADGSRVRSFDVDMEQRMHLIVVSDDLATFMHVHPVLGSDGVFRIDVRFPKPAIYEIYADAAPHALGHPVFRFEIAVGVRRPAITALLGDPTTTASAGPYVVRIGNDRFTAGVETQMTVTVIKNGRDAADLHPYLGALAHVVALNAADRSYTHVHAMAKSSSSMVISGEPGNMTMDMSGLPPLPATAVVPATMRVSIDLPRPGGYKVWIQFVGGSHLYAAPFVVVAR